MLLHLIFWEQLRVDYMGINQEQSINAPIGTPNVKVFKSRVTEMYHHLYSERVKVDKP